MYLCDNVKEKRVIIKLNITKIKYYKSDFKALYEN